jgi:hypothetical protein
VRGPEGRYKGDRQTATRQVVDVQLAGSARRAFRQTDISARPKTCNSPGRQTAVSAR